MDESCGLLHQCRGFIESDRRKCSEDHWSRGNGWGYMALAELVRYLPADSPHRSKAERIFTDLSLAFLRWQASGGLWRQELTSQAAWEESSGSALILYGLGVGLRTGLLDRGLFWKPYQNGLAGLLRCINPDYSTENSCPGCLCPGDGTIQAYITEKQPEHDEHHSFGAFMLALVEAHRNGFTDSEWRSL